MARRGGEDREAQQATVGLPVPAPESDLFRHTATDDLLQLLLDNPYEQFTIRELSRLTDNAAQSVKRAVDALAAIALPAVVTRPYVRDALFSWNIEPFHGESSSSGD